MSTAWPLTGRGTAAAVLAVACFVGAGVLGSVQLLAFGVFLVVLMAVSLVALRAARPRARVSRTLSSDVVAVGESTRVVVEVTMLTVLPTTPGTWADTVPEALQGRSDGPFPGFGSGLRGEAGVVDLAYEVRAVHRGVHALGPLRVVVRDPFGVTRRVQTLGGTTRVVITPRVVGLPPLLSFHGAVGGMLRATTARLGQGADDLIARPYQPGDSMRRIHWRATAHTDALMVRQEEEESTPEATVVLDRTAARWPAAAIHPGGDADFEAAVSACVSAARALAHQGYLVHVTDTAGATLARLPAGDDRGALTALADTFATVRAQDSAGLDALTRLLAGAAIGPLIVVTGALEDADIAALTALPAHSAHPVLLATAAAPLSRAAAAGWFTAAVGAGVDLREAWEQVRGGTVRGVRRVAR